MDKIKLALGVFIVISVLLSGAFYIDELNEPLRVYICESIGLAGPCIKLSKINADDSSNTLQIKVATGGDGIVNDGIIAIDSDGLLDYIASNVDFEAISVTVLGWYI